MSYLHLLVLLFGFHALAYQIDTETCGENASWIRSVLFDSFEMASTATQVLETAGSARDPNENRLIKLLLCAPNEDPTTADLSIAIAHLSGVPTMATLKDDLDTRTDAEVSNDVIIFCTMEGRVSQNGRGEWVHNKHPQVLEGAFDENEIPECLGTTDVTVAVTWNLKPTWRTIEGEDGATAQQQEHHASEITICPWFVEWAKFKRYRNWRDLNLKSGLASLAVPLVTKGYPYAPVDAANLIDKVLLHELTHTNAGAKTVDVRQGFEKVPFWKAAYGWRNALKLTTLTGNPLDQSAQNNADTLALFASGLRLLRQQSPVYIADDGSLQPEAPAARRDVQILPRELELPTTPAAFETFITLVRERQARETS